MLHTIGSYVCVLRLLLSALARTRLNAHIITLNDPDRQRRPKILHSYFKHVSYFFQRSSPSFVLQTLKDIQWAQYNSNRISFFEEHHFLAVKKNFQVLLKSLMKELSRRVKCKAILAFPQLLIVLLGRHSVYLGVQILVKRRRHSPSLFDNKERFSLREH